MAVLILAVVLIIITGALFFWAPPHETCLARAVHSLGISIAFGVSSLSQHRDLS
jgi:hypothetical protein